ncbi:hypothetical protein INT46_004000 [Mucor plumbeus]|uniref:C2H2-type domain-containing protein n=1 Tax=Mucor plumbeus TaxID=97098 RepID=A0A8H7R1K9_9FUNG|nr:hypothetical protein INT46_004000 [Mucor plumbeus]
MPKVTKKIQTRSKPVKKEMKDTVKTTLSLIKSDFERRYACPECDKVLSCGSSLKRHLLLKHKKEVTLKFGRTYKGGRAFSNQRYYLKKKKPKVNAEKTDKQLRRSVVNQRAYQKKIFKTEAKSLKETVIKITNSTIDEYKEVEALRKHLSEASERLLKIHDENLYFHIEKALGLPDTFQIRYSIAFYFILAIANRLPNFINLDYDKKDVALGLCWRNTEKDGLQDDFEYNEKITDAVFTTLDDYFLGKGKAIKEQKHNFMAYIASFLNIVFTACGNKYILIKREAKNPCFWLHSLFNEPLISLPPFTKKKVKSEQGDTVSTKNNEEVLELSQVTNNNNESI